MSPIGVGRASEASRCLKLRRMRRITALLYFLSAARIVLFSLFILRPMIGSKLQIKYILIFIVKEDNAIHVPLQHLIPYVCQSSHGRPGPGNHFPPSCQLVGQVFSWRPTSVGTIPNDGSVVFSQLQLRKAATGRVLGAVVVTSAAFLDQRVLVSLENYVSSIVEGSYSPGKCQYFLVSGHNTGFLKIPSKFSRGS